MGPCGPAPTWTRQRRWAQDRARFWSAAESSAWHPCQLSQGNGGGLPRFKRLRVVDRIGHLRNRILGIRTKTGQGLEGAQLDNVLVILLHETSEERDGFAHILVVRVLVSPQYEAQRDD